MSAMFVPKFRNFAQNTTFHGFHQPAESERYWKRGIWILIIAASTGIFCMQAFKQLGNYLDGRTSTIIGALSEEEYRPPPIYVMIERWHWIDSSKLRIYNISDEVLQVAQSYMHPRFRSYSELPVSEAKRRYQTKLQEMNLSDATDVLALLATDSYDASNSSSVSMQKHVADSNMYFIVDSSMADKNVFSRSMRIIIAFNFTSYWANIIGHSRLDNISETMLRTGFAPLLAVSDLSQSVALEPGYTYQISADTRLQRRLRDCRPGNTIVRKLWYVPSLCPLECELEANVSVNASSCYNHQLTANIDPASNIRKQIRPLCSYGFYINGSLHGEDKPILRTLSQSEEQMRQSRIKQCQTQCLPACDTYTTTLSVIIQQLGYDTPPDNASTIKFRYPQAQSVSVVEEIYQYTWLDLLGDIGGLLGLWLGGSIISIFEIIHYCCCAAAAPLANERRVDPVGHIEVKPVDVTMNPVGDGRENVSPV